MSHVVALVSFRDGPAKGKSLELRRWPRFLRVEIAADGKVDALDQPEDLPQLGATLHTYEQIPGATGHVCGRGRGQSCFPTLDYRHNPLLEPSDDWDIWGSRVMAFAELHPIGS